MRSKVKRVLSMLLVITMVLSTVAISPVEAASGGYKDGWTVNVTWGDMSRNYVWNPLKDEKRQPVITVTYRITNAAKAYSPGDLVFKIPGIGSAVRGRIVEASDKLSDWNVSWSSSSDVYTFTNTFSVSPQQSISGGFQFMWTFNARDNTTGYSKIITPQFSTTGGSDPLTLENLTYSFKSVTDSYAISVTSRAVGYNDLTELDVGTYAWYDITTNFGLDSNSRGLYNSDYYIWFNLPSGVSIDDLMFPGGYTPVKDIAGRTGSYGFYLSQGSRSDSLSSPKSFRVGFKYATCGGKTFTFNGHLDRLYNDETTWIRTARTDKVTDTYWFSEKVDDDVSISIPTKNRFVYEGYIYHVCKTAPYNRESPYASRYLSTNLFNSKVLEFTLHGSANRNYGETIRTDEGIKVKTIGAGMEEEENPGAIASPADAVEFPDEEDPDSDTIHIEAKETGRTYGQNHPEDEAVRRERGDYEAETEAEESAGEEETAEEPAESEDYRLVFEYPGEEDEKASFNYLIVRPDSGMETGMFTLNGGESKEFTDLPENTEWTIKEHDGDGRWSGVIGEETEDMPEITISPMSSDVDVATPSNAKPKEEPAETEAESKIETESKEETSEAESEEENEKEEESTGSRKITLFSSGSEGPGISKGSEKISRISSDETEPVIPAEETEPEKKKSVFSLKADEEPEEDDRTEVSEATPADADVMPIASYDGGEEYEGTTRIGENDPYTLIIGDDKLAITNANGELRELADSEYDISYIRIPASSQSYSYEVYAARQQNTKFSDYMEIATGRLTGQSQTLHIADGFKAIFIRVNNIVGTYSQYIYIGVKFHLSPSIQDTINLEGYVANFDYVRALCQDGTDDITGITERNYIGPYVSIKLADHDRNLYGRLQFRWTDNVYLRTISTKIETNMSLQRFTETEKVYHSTLTATGHIAGEDENGTISRFSLYVVMPNGLLPDELIFDGDEPSMVFTGSATYAAGGSVSNDDFMSHMTINDEGSYQGNLMYVFDFDFSDAPLKATSDIRVSVSYPVFVRYSDVVMYGMSYKPRSYLMIQDAGVPNIIGFLSNLSVDTYDIDRDGNKSEKLTQDSDSQDILIEANEWREAAEKYVASSYSSDSFVQSTSVRKFAANDTAEHKKEAQYRYRLDFSLGSDSAANIIFYDRMERGAEIHQAGAGQDEVKQIPSEWQGTFVSVDTSNLARFGGIISVYYSSDVNKTFDLNSTKAGWTKMTQTKNIWTAANPANVKVIGIILDTSSCTNRMIDSPAQMYAMINMQAPTSGKSESQAVNQYTVSYDAYDPASRQSVGHRDGLLSGETYVKYVDGLGRFTLQKRDGDDPITKEDGSVEYSPLDGAKFQIYREDGTPYLEGDGKTVNSSGKLIVRNIPYGKYYYEEVEAPLGYYKIAEGKHEFTISNETSNLVIDVLDERIPGDVTLTKNDMQFTGYGPLAGAKFSLYTADGKPVYTDDKLAYLSEEDMAAGKQTVSIFTTDAQGQIHITGLPWGSYYFVEIEPPKGYELNPTHVNFTVSRYNCKPGDLSIHVDASADDNELTASIKLVKKDATSGSPIDDAVFSLYRQKRGDEAADLEVASLLRTNAMGEIIVDNLQFGTYYFLETRNPTGYMIHEGESAKTGTATLDANTVGQTLSIEYTNERMKGSVEMTKNDEYKQIVEGAKYELWYKADTDESGQYRKITPSEVTTTDTDGTYFVTSEEGMIHINGLSWGDYYFLEISAPQGYEVSPKHEEFTISRETVENTIYMDVTDERKKGEVELVKYEKNHKETTLADAVYELYSSDNTKMLPGTDYTTDKPNNEIKTGADGKVRISNIRQGGYYLKEITPPAGYSLSNEYIRFSVGLETCTILQKLDAEDEKGKATLVVNKEINAVYEEFGNPTFIFTVKGAKGTEYTQSITLNELNLKGSVTFTVDADDTYTVYEYVASRYGLTEIKNVQNITATSLENGTATADLTGVKDKAEVTFKNEIKQYEDENHADNVTNIVKKKRMVTAITVDYHGPNPINDLTAQILPGYDADTEEYHFQESDMTVTAYYDDGTSEVLDWGTYTLSPDFVSGENGDISATIDIFYTENNVTVTTSFSVDVALTWSPRYTIKIDPNGGKVRGNSTAYTNSKGVAQLWNPDSGTSWLDSLIKENIKEGTVITLPAEPPSPPVD